MSYWRRVGITDDTAFVHEHISGMSRHSPGQRSLRLGRWSTPGGHYVVTAVVASRDPLFSDHALAQGVAPLLDRGAHWRDSRSLCWELMPDHFHVLLEVGGDDSLSRLVNRLKSHTARDANLSRSAPGRVWQRGFHERALRHGVQMAAVARYIVHNPVRAGLVGSVGRYPYWNAVWL